MAGPRGCRACQVAAGPIDQVQLAARNLQSIAVGFAHRSAQRRQADDCYAVGLGKRQRLHPASRQNPLPTAAPPAAHYRCSGKCAPEHATAGLRPFESLPAPVCTPRTGLTEQRPVGGFPMASAGTRSLGAAIQCHQSGEVDGFAWADSVAEHAMRVPPPQRPRAPAWAVSRGRCCHSPVRS